MRVPAGTSNGKTFRVSGRGVTTPKRTGDLLVTVDVQVPTTVDDDRRALLEQLRQLEADVATVTNRAFTQSFTVMPLWLSSMRGNCESRRNGGRTSPGKSIARCMK